jgi:hypothetical protein
MGDLGDLLIVGVVVVVAAGAFLWWEGQQSLNRAAMRCRTDPSIRNTQACGLVLFGAGG